MTRMEADLSVLTPAPPTAPPLVDAASGRGRAPAQLSREQILDATAACLAELGYDATTIRTIARRLNCAVGSIYRYFTDKRELLAAVTQRAFAPVVQSAGAGAPVSETVRQYAATAAADESAYRLMFFLAAVGGDSRNDSIAVGTDRRGGRMPAVIVHLIDQWARQMGDVDRARRLWSLVHGSVTIGQDLRTILDDVRRLAGDAGAADADAATRRSQAAETEPRTIGLSRTAAVADDVCLL